MGGAGDVGQEGSADTAEGTPAPSQRFSASGAKGPGLSRPPLLLLQTPQGWPEGPQGPGAEGQLKSQSFSSRGLVGPTSMGYGLLGRAEDHHPHPPPPAS